MLIPDILIDVSFYSTDKGGRASPTPPDFFGCPFDIDGVKHDGRLLLSEIGSIEPGASNSNVPVKFLCSELVMPKICIGKKLYLWEMGNIAEGVVTKIINDDYEK